MRTFRRFLHERRIGLLPSGQAVEITDSEGEGPVWQIVIDKRARDEIVRPALRKLRDPNHVSRFRAGVLNLGRMRVAVFCDAHSSGEGSLTFGCVIDDKPVAAIRLSPLEVTVLEQELDAMRTEKPRAARAARA